MKKIFIILLFPVVLNAQTLNTDSMKIQHALDSLSIKLNRPETPEGYTLYFGCDSMAFFKRVYKDTIQILTPAGMTPMSYDSKYEFNSFSRYIQERRSFPPSFPTKYMYDGRILIVDYGVTTFIYRNDSLYLQEVDDKKFVVKMFDIVDQYVKGKIDSLKMERKISVARDKFKPILMTGFIFNKKMFDSTDTVDIPISLNKRTAKVTLEAKLMVNGIFRYAILIEENYQNTKTAVRYTFDENICFYKWEDCKE